MTLGSACLLALVTLTPAAASDGPITWRQNYAQALQEAKQGNKLLLINVHTSWCLPCRRLQQTTLQDQALAREIMQKCVPLSLDGDAEAGLVRQMGVRAFPTQLFVAPSGQIVNKLEGFVPADSYTSTLRTAIARANLQPRMIASQPTSRPANAASTVSSSPAATPRPTVSQNPPALRIGATVAQTEQLNTGSAISDTAIKGGLQKCTADTPLALSGYCPVTMITKAELISGAAEVCGMYRGKRYHFRSDAEMKKFEKNPKKYLPAADGVCLVSLVDEGKETMGNIECPAIFEEHVYLFTDLDHRRKFLGDPEKYVERYGKSAQAASTTIR